MNQVVGPARVSGSRAKDALRKRDGISLAAARWSEGSWQTYSANISASDVKAAASRSSEYVAATCASHRRNHARGRQIAARRKGLDGSAVRPLRAYPLWPAALTRGCEPAQRSPRRRHIVLAPEQVAISHRFCPERHGEGRVGLLRLAEALRSILVLEAVQQRETAQERLLRGGRTGISERDHAEAARFSYLAGRCGAPAGRRSQSMRG